MKNWRELLSLGEEINQKKIVAGYDGFVDTTARPVAQSASASSPVEMFETIRQFGEFLISKAEKSCSIELKVESRHLGGNLPFLSRGAAALGLCVTGIGMMGEGGVMEEPFKELAGKYYPFAASGQSTCLEFYDGKVMLAPTVTLPRDSWEMVFEATAGMAPELFAAADLIALVNWSELTFAQYLWERTYEESLAETACDKERFAFFDLCDISRKTATEIRAVLTLIGKYAKQRTAILSLNDNEAQVLGEKVFGEECRLAEIAHQIRVQYQIDEVLIHTTKKAMLFCKEGFFAETTRFVEQPVKSTGAGDHFNAASCFAAVMKLTPEARLRFANCAASLYVQTGKTPELWQIVEVIEKQGDL
ncbi:carbohydrate kinase family protein [Ohessyouella blattaphilus]|uniref:Carbohydrate kinase family protein n=1 Tax=Ohessyouella blattaphilus TaxID=2949333 RepID=A0ABT1EIK2_9FIRM|nr:carbohydrate kinase family protein [Ohessyouella blattaphilus]MCP1109516.1 carbohydrate kinase family protein [Ohessyouella blattaphilus]MCR8562910.1 carbohydrate kinase family protein [Ohessyouella blattaphilus]MDL2250096.1 carbohydrate kinase family protein [Lachnospiraceae bacterium OttesenSCG-928-J05]